MDAACTAHEGTSSASCDAPRTHHPEAALEGFSRTIFTTLRRADQRKWAHAYLRGLLATPGKKSVRRLAGAISSDPSVIRSLRQFISLSPWDADVVMGELTRWVADHRPASVWTISRAVVPKSGDRSVGVHRYFDPASGRTLNGQLALGSFLRVGTAQVPVDWSLHLSPSWAEDHDRRRDARIPDSEEHLPLWAHALRLVDRLSSRMEASSALVLADMSDEPDVEHLLNGLHERRQDFVVAVPPHLAVHPVGDSTAGAPEPGGATAWVTTRAPEPTVVA
ncbi:MAG: transposase, partial [Streptomyces sp.]